MIITASHQKGGVGKSTLVWNLAIAYSYFHKIKVLDLDLQKTFTHSYQLRNINYKNGKLPKNCSKSINNIEMLNLDAEDDRKKKLIEILQSVKKNEILLIDSGGFDSELNRIAMIASNILLTPVSTKFYELLGLQKYEEKLKELSSKTKKKVIGTVVFNKINPNTKNVDEIIDFIKRSEYFNCLPKIIRQRVDYENTPGLGLGVIEISKESKAKEEFVKFVNALNNYIKSSVK